MLRMDDCIDLIIPRGGRGLIERVAAESRIPVLKHLDGLCHTYVHGKADPEKAREIVLNAKMRRTGVCGATETLLIDKARLPFAEPIIADLVDAGCEVRGDDEALKLHDKVKMATTKDWDTEYLDAIIAVRVVDDMAGAIEHINNHGSHHTEAILTEDEAAAEQFLARGRCRHRPGQRLDPVRRWRRVRHGRRDRHLHRQAPRPRPRRGRAAHQLQVPRPRQRPDPACAGCADFVG